MARTKVRLKQGDEVRVVTGKHKGSEGKVLRVFPDDNRVIVENVNVIKRAQRPTQENPRGGFREQEAPIHASNVRLLDPQTGELTRIGHKLLETGERVRISSKTGAQLED
jgi:large subunit ribosomal protein L24